MSRDRGGARVRSSSAAGHAGDGNIHLSVFQPDDDVRHRVMHAIIAAGVGMGGAISAEHGIGKEKKQYFLELEDPNKIALMHRIKAAFDPERHPESRNAVRLTRRPTS